MLTCWKQKMTYSNKAPILLMVTFTVLPFIGFSLSKHDIGFRKLSPEEILPVSTWIPNAEYFKTIYCGPQEYLRVSVVPFPIKYNHFGRIEINFTAAHDLIGGDVIANFNRWPYHFKTDACDYLWGRFRTKICPLIKGETYYFHVAGVLDLPDIDKGHYAGNVSVVNSDEEVVFCLSIDLVI